MKIFRQVEIVVIFMPIFFAQSMLVQKMSQHERVKLFDWQYSTAISRILTQTQLGSHCALPETTRLSGQPQVNMDIAIDRGKEDLGFEVAFNSLGHIATR